MLSQLFPCLIEEVIYSGRKTAFLLKLINLTQLFYDFFKNNLCLDLNSQNERNKKKYFL